MSERDTGETLPTGEAEPKGAEVGAGQGDTGGTQQGGVSIEALIEEQKRLMKQVAGLESLYGRWSNEVGEVRKVLAELSSQIGARRDEARSEDADAKIRELWESGRYEEAFRLQEEQVARRVSSEVSREVAALKKTVAELEAQARAAQLRQRYPDYDEVLPDVQDIAQRYQSGELTPDDILILAAHGKRVKQSNHPAPVKSPSPPASKPEPREEKKREESGSQEPDYNPFMP